MRARPRAHCTPGRTPRVAAIPRLYAFLALLLSGPYLPAQTQPASAGPPYTFHIYEDLLQIPALVLNSLHGSYRGLTPELFSIRIDDGPPFHPRHIRLEGDDPLTLTLVLDAGSQNTADLLAGINESLAKLPTDWLASRDHLSVYALDCALVRTSHDEPYTPALLQTAVGAALSDPTLHVGTNCSASRKLWDNLTAVVAQTGNLPGRRVIVVVTNGQDDASQQNWHTLEEFAGRYSITLIGLRTTDDIMPLVHTKIPTQILLQVVQEDAFGMACNSTGGLVLPVDRKTLNKQLERTVTLLRNRYILEFARPSNGTAGLHDIRVKIPDDSAILRVNGISFPLQNKDLLAAPGTLPSDPTRAPTIGDRQPLKAPQ